MMSQLIQTILVTVNTEHSTHVALDKAEQLAKQTHAELHLLTSTYDSITQYSDFLSEPQYLQIQQHMLSNKEALLDEIADEIENDGVKCINHVRFTPNIADALDDLTAALDIDLVMKRKSEDLDQINPFYTPTDRQCIRHSHKPLWLVNDDELTYQSIVVAIDPISGDKAHQILNEKIVLFSRWLADKYDANVIYINVYEAPIQTVGFEMAAIAYDDLLDNVARHHEEAMNEFAKAHDIDPKNCIIDMGDPAQIIAHNCDTHKADLLIIGTVGRSGIAGFFIGNTVEDVLGKVHCEVLCIPAQE